MTNYFSRFFAMTLTLALAACSGGGGSSSTPTGLPNPTPSPTGTATSTPTNSPGGVATEQVTITAPPRTGAIAAQNPISTIVAVITSINGNTAIPGDVAPTTVVNVTGNTCTNTTTGTNCSFALPAPAGTIAVVITTYAGNNPIATGSFAFNSTGAAGQSNTFSLGAIAKLISVTPPNRLTIRVPSTQALLVTVTDPSGATIGGSAPFANAITLTDQDTSGSTQLEVGNDASTLGSNVPYANPSSVINLVYNGNGFGNVAITATGTTAIVATQSKAQVRYTP